MARHPKSPLGLPPQNARTDWEAQQRAQDEFMDWIEERKRQDDRFKTIWHCDFEFRENAYGQPVPVCMYACEQHTGAEIFLWRDQLLALKQAPFSIGPDDLFVAYSAAAELSCFSVLGWQAPRNIFDPMIEVRCRTNGLLIEGLSNNHPGLLDALEIFGLPSTMTRAEKTRMRDLILGKEHYDAEERSAIQRYNATDVEATLALMPPLMPQVDLPRALFYGRFCQAVTSQQMTGLPIDRPVLDRWLENWNSIRLHFIRRNDEHSLYDDEGSFVESRLADLIHGHGWEDWPRTPTGKFKRDAQTMGQQSSRHQELRKTAHLMSSIAELRLNALADVVGDDGFARSWLAPFGSKTARNQPPGATFLPALPAWVRGLLRPPEGWVLIELDWVCEEFGLIAGMCGDPGMIHDYLSADVYESLGERLGLVAPEGGQKEFRNRVLKPLALGQIYGMSPYGISAKTKRPLRWARDVHARHRLTYPVLHRWLGDIAAQAKFDRIIHSPLGWPMIVTGETKHRTLLNFMAQAGGSDCMRVAGIAAREAGIRTCCSVHDSFWILVPEDDEEASIAKMVEIMGRAGEAVGGLRLGVEVKAIVRASQNLGDSWKPGDKGFDMWTEINEF
jgi:DNA polymerase I